MNNFRQTLIRLHGEMPIAGRMLRRFASVALLLLCGCTIAPHGSKATHDIWLYDANGRVWRHEKFTDRSAGGGGSVMTLTALQNAALFHTNSVLQTGGWFILGNGTVGVDPQATSMIGAVGTAAGNIIGAAAKKATGLP